MTTLTDGERIAIARLSALLELLPSELDRRMAPAGMTSFEFTLLEALHESDKRRLRLSALASRTNATPQRLSRVVTSLERKGYVQRTPCEDDGRAINAVLTDDGARSYVENRDLHDTAIRRAVLDGLDSSAVAHLAEVSLAILNSLDPERRLAVTAPAAGVECAADPVLLPARR
jgi:DNA-binding MarR family transcriptional regulator